MKSIIFGVLASLSSFIAFAEPSQNLDSVFFEKGKFSIEKSESLKIKESISKTDKNIFYLMSTTDVSGDKEYNLELSEKRAKSVINEIRKYKSDAYFYYSYLGESDSDCEIENNNSEDVIDSTYCNRLVTINY